MPLTWKSGESLGQAKARQSREKTKSTKKRRATPKGGKSMASQKAITKSNNDRSSVRVSAAPAAKVTKVEKNPSFGVLKSDKQAKKSLPDVSTTVTRALKPTLKKATPKVSITPTEQKKVSAKKSATSIASKAKPKGGQSHQATNVDGSAANKAATEGVINGKNKDRINLSADNKTVGYPHVPGVDMDTYNKIATSQKALSGGVGSFSLLGQSIKDKYTNDGVSYNQAYWAGKLAHGQATGNDNIQSELAAEQAKIGMKKVYSGDRVVTEDMKRKASDDLSRVTGSMAVIDDPKMSDKEKDELRKIGVDVGGVTATTKKSGLFGENFETTYDYGNKRPTIVQKGTDPVVGGVRLGDRKSTTYADGVEVATKTGQDPLGRDAKVTRPDVAGHIDDQVKAEPKAEPITKDDLKDIDNQIANEKDPEVLKELHRRRLALMRSMRTQTRYASLLADADVKRANLMGIL